MKQFIAFVKKEFYHIFRDRRTMLILLGMPVVQIILFGFAISTEVKNVRLAVLDPSNDVVDDDTKAPKPAKLYFIVPREYNDLLRKALLISSNNIEIIPVPRNAGYSENPKETQIVNEEIENFVLSKSVYIAG